MEEYIDLDDYISTSYPTTDELREIMLNLVKGLIELHNLGIVHKDIKPDNILINLKNLKIKYIDFGFSCFESDIDCLNKDRGTPLYMSPEMHALATKNKNYTFNILKKADIWSLGMTFLELITKEKLLKHIQTLEELRWYLGQLVELNSTVPVNGILIPDLRDVVKNMLEARWQLRANLFDIQKKLK